MKTETSHLNGSANGVHPTINSRDRYSAEALADQMMAQTDGARAYRESRSYSFWRWADAQGVSKAQFDALPFEEQARLVLEFSHPKHPPTGYEPKPNTAARIGAIRSGELPLGMQGKDGPQMPKRSSMRFRIGLAVALAALTIAVVIWLVGGHS